MSDKLLEYLSVIVGFQTIESEAKQKQLCLEWIEKTFLSQASGTLHRGEVKGSPYLYLEHPSPSLLWFAHTDVVPGRDDQFSVRIDGDRAYGRGVKDMKGAALTFLMAYAQARAAGIAPNVSILLTSDEEVGGATPKELVARGVFDHVPVAFTPDSGEHPFIVTELKGAVWVRVRCTGKSGHAALPWESTNPIPSLMRAVLALKDALPDGTSDEWHMTMSPTELSGSDAPNRIPSEASCTLDIRFPGQDYKTPADALAWVQTQLPPDCRIEILNQANPISIDSQHPMVQRMKRLAEQVMGSPVSIGREHGSSDARYFCVHGIPAFLYGPVGGDLHGEHEWVSLSSLRQHVELNQKLLQELA